jgi:hypothetical protein
MKSYFKMTSTTLTRLNFEEVRRRSTMLWQALPEEFYHWKPDQQAMSSIEMVRHVLESEYDHYRIIKNRGTHNLDYLSPWEGRPYSTIADELDFAEPFRIQFLALVNSFSDQNLSGILIARAAPRPSRCLGDYLLRIAYHESVHAGQFLSYLRAMNIARPDIWD